MVDMVIGTVVDNVVISLQVVEFKGRWGMEAMSLITRRSQVQILSPQPKHDKDLGLIA